MAPFWATFRKTLPTFYFKIWSQCLKCKAENDLLERYQTIQTFNLCSFNAFITCKGIWIGLNQNSRPLKNFFKVKSVGKIKSIVGSGLDEESFLGTAEDFSQLFHLNIDNFYLQLFNLHKSDYTQSKVRLLIKAFFLRDY